MICSTFYTYLTSMTAWQSFFINIKDFYKLDATVSLAESFEV